MTRALPRTNFHSSRLIRFLADLALLEPAAPGNPFAEKLSHWLDFTDAITLCAVHNPGTANRPGLPAGVKPSNASAAAGDQFTRVRANLISSITKSGSPQVSRPPLELPTTELASAKDIAAAYAPYRRYHLALQRDMDVSIRPLRIHVREVLAKASPALNKLATLDAALDGILREREGKLLSTLPLLFEKRFAQLFKAHQQQIADTRQTDNPALWMQAGTWLTRFCSELQTVLLAELDVRLQPTEGLIEALNNEISKHK